MVMLLCYSLRISFSWHTDRKLISFCIGFKLSLNAWAIWYQHCLLCPILNSMEFFCFYFNGKACWKPLYYCVNENKRIFCLTYDSWRAEHTLGHLVTDSHTMRFSNRDTSLFQMFEIKMNKLAVSCFDVTFHFKWIHWICQKLLLKI